MANLIICEEQELVDVADAIRAQTGSTETMSLGAMAVAVNTLSANGGSVNADWNAKEGEAGYVKNRTHWMEEGGGTVVEAQTITGFSEMENGIYGVENPFNFAFADGETYTVTWDGVEYECTSEDVEGLLCLGNSNYVSMQKGGDIPFALIYVGVLYVSTESTDEVHTISVKQKNGVVHHLDPKYIKDMYYEKSADYPIIDNKNLEFDTSRLSDGGAAEIELRINKSKAPVLDNTYTVIWDGVTYDGLVCFYDGIVLTLGSDYESLIAGNSEYPFCIGVDTQGQAYGQMYIFTMSDKSTHTVTIIEHSTVVRKIDKKYLPNNGSTMFYFFPSTTGGHMYKDEYGNDDVFGADVEDAMAKGAIYVCHVEDNKIFVPVEISHGAQGYMLTCYTDIIFFTADFEYANGGVS